MKYTPRPYQSRVIQEAREAIRDIRKRFPDRGPRLMIQLSTGGGKTLIAGFIILGHMQSHPNPHVAFLCHRDFLVDQTSNTFASLEIDHSYVSAGRWMNKWSSVHVCMIPTLRNRIDKLHSPTLVIWDEAQHIGAATWAKIMQAWPDATHIGLSATPVRLDGKGLDDFFDDMVCGPTTSELIEIGALSDYVAYSPTKPDMTTARIVRGDYHPDDADDAMEKSVIVGDLVQHYLRLARGKRGMYFFRSVKRSEETAAAFRDAGVMAVHLDGKSTTWERQQAAKAFAHGDIQVISNVDIAAEGFDIAAQAGVPVTVDVVGLARPTASLGLFLQQVGRVLRPAPGKKAIILDHAGNIARHGLPDDDREWSLEGNAKSRSGAASVTKECENCFARIHNTATVCRHCGHICGSDRGEGGGRPDVEQVDGELEQVDKDALKRQKKVEEWTARSLDDLIDLARRRGYRYPEKWAGHKWTARQAAARKKESADQQALAFYAENAR